MADQPISQRRASGILTSTEIELITDWIRGDWYEPAAPSAAAPVPPAP